MGEAELQIIEPRSLFTVLYKYIAKMGLFPSYEEMYGSIIGLGTGVIMNGFHRRPLISRPILLVPLATAGFFSGTYLKKYNYDKLVAREVYIQDYIRLHPEDFPQEEPGLVSDFDYTEFTTLDIWENFNEILEEIRTELNNSVMNEILLNTIQEKYFTESSWDMYIVSAIRFLTSYGYQKKS